MRWVLKRAQEARNQPVHQLEVGGQRRRLLLGRIEDFLVEPVGIEHGAGAAVDEDEPRLDDEALALHVNAVGLDDAAAERIDDLAVGGDETRRLRVREQHGPGHDQRVLMLLAELFPELGVLEDGLIALEILFVADLAVAGLRTAWQGRNGLQLLGAAFRRRGRLSGA